MNSHGGKLLILDGTIPIDKRPFIQTQLEKIRIEDVAVLGCPHRTTLEEFCTVPSEESPRLLAPTLSERTMRYQYVIVVAEDIIFDLIDWLGSTVGREWVLLKSGSQTIRPKGVSLPEYSLNEITVDLNRMAKPPRQITFHGGRESLVSSGASYQWQLDEQGFPLLAIPEIGVLWSLFPLTKIQYEVYWAAETPQSANQWYQARLLRNRRQSFRRWQTHEGLLMSDLLCREARKLAEWYGGWLPSIMQWRSAYRWLDTQPAILPPTELLADLHPAAKALWEGLFRKIKPQTLLDLSLMRGGVTEWVMDGDRPAGLGKPRAQFHRALGNPLQGAPIRPINLDRRIHHFGMRIAYG